MRRLTLVVSALAAAGCLAHTANIEQSQLLGRWAGRIERPGVEAGRRMAQTGTAEFVAGHKFVCNFENPEQEALSEQGTWSLKNGQLFVTTAEANGKKTKPVARPVEISHQPLEMRLPVESGAWFLVLRPVQTPQ